jgi:hypothetical protein
MFPPSRLITAAIMFSSHWSFVGLCAALMTLHVLSRPSLSGMTLRPYLIISRPVIVHVSHIPRAPHPHFPISPSPLRARIRLLITLDINTSREPRVTSLALVVVRLQLRTIPMFLRGHSTLLIMFASCQHYETILLEHRIYNVSS